MVINTPNAHMELNKVDVKFEAWYLCSCEHTVGFPFDTRPDIPSTVALQHMDDEHQGTLVEIVEIVGTVVWRKED